MSKNINCAKTFKYYKGVFKMGYFIVFVIIAVCIGIYFSKRDEPMSPSSWFKGIGVIAFAMVIVNGFYHVDDIKQGGENGVKQAENRENTQK